MYVCIWVHVRGVGGRERKEAAVVHLTGPLLPSPQAAAASSVQSGQLGRSVGRGCVGVLLQQDAWRPNGRM